MHDEYFNNFLKLMRTYIKTLRLKFEGQSDIDLHMMRYNYYSTFNYKIDTQLTKEYNTLPDSEWKKKLKNYKEALDRFDADHEKEGWEYCKALLKIRFKEEYLFKQNQSYMGALDSMRRRVNHWVDLTFSSEEKELFAKVETNLISELNTRNTLPTLQVNELAREDIFIALSKFIPNKEHHPLLKVLLTGEEISCFIIIKRNQNSIAYLFRQVKDAGYIIEDKTKIRDWILYWFRVSDAKSTTGKELTPTTVYDALSKDKKPKKNNRIPYNPKNTIPH